MNASSRLGMLDWGIGGVGVFRVLRQLAPRVPVLYCSDSGHTPYGLLGRDALAQRVAKVITHLARRGASSVVIACNAASTVIDMPRVQQLGLSLGVPIIGMIAPALSLLTKEPGGTLAVIAGARTIRSGVYRRGLARDQRRIVQRIAQPLSAHIEAGSTGSARFAEDLTRILKPLRAADALLLACTHYPAIAHQIAARLPQTRLIDPAEAVARHLLATHLLPESDAPDRFVTTGDARQMRAAALRAWDLDPGPCACDRIA